MTLLAGAPAKSPLAAPATSPRAVASPAPASPAATPPAGESVRAARLARGQEAFRHRRDPARAREALEIFRALRVEDPLDPEAAWHSAMACYYVGIRLETTDEARLKLYAEGRDAGKRAWERARELKAKCAPCSFWTAINMALYGQTAGILKMAFSLNEIQDLLKASLADDPAYAWGGAYRLLGTIQWKLPGVFGGSDRRAREYFERAVAIAPDEPLQRLFLARLLREKFDDAPGADQVLKQALAVPYPPDERVEAQDAWCDLRRAIGMPPEKSSREAAACAAAAARSARESTGGPSS